MNQFEVLRVLLLELDRQFPDKIINQSSMDALALFVNEFIKANCTELHG